MPKLEEETQRSGTLGSRVYEGCFTEGQQTGSAGLRRDQVVPEVLRGQTGSPSSKTVETSEPFAKREGCLRAVSFPSLGIIQAGARWMTSVRDVVVEILALYGKWIKSPLRPIFSYLFAYS